MNDNAIAKLREAKLCTLFCLVPRAPVLYRTRECCMSIWLLHATHWSFSFCSLQKLSRQQILEACLKKFLNGFHPCLEISCSHPCFKENSDLEVQKPWIPDCFATILFHNFFQERDILFSKGIYCCSQIFIFIFFRKT